MSSEETQTVSEEIVWHIRFKRLDGSYLIKLPQFDVLYHVDENDNPELFTQVDQAAQGQDIPFEPVPEPLPLTVDDFRNAIQAQVDAKAQERRYDNGNSLASYVNSTVSEWAAEATAFVAWRDQVWAYAYAALADVESGNRPVPTVAELLSELPTMTWPE